eukprot:6465826-Amphidinium_carterae.1
MPFTRYPSTRPSGASPPRRTLTPQEGSISLCLSCCQWEARTPLSAGGGWLHFWLDCYEVFFLPFAAGCNYSWMTPSW